MGTLPCPSSGLCISVFKAHRTVLLPSPLLFLSPFPTTASALAQAPPPPPPPPLMWSPTYSAQIFSPFSSATPSPVFASLGTMLPTGLTPLPLYPGSEVKLGIYTFENCVHAVLQTRVPKVPPWQLAQWYGAARRVHRARALRHVSQRARLCLGLVDQLDLVGRTAELARTYGIDFTSVMTRGSQYRVESLLARLAHTQNMLLVSPSKEQVARQPAMACLPLVLEPESCMYTSPVVVLDFQSLYPSMMIAHNLCFSTLVGNAQHCQPADSSHQPGEVPRLGVTRFRQPSGLLKRGGGAAGDSLDPDSLIVTPNGYAFAPKSGVPLSPSPCLQ